MKNSQKAEIFSVQDPKDVPRGKHFVIMVYKSVTRSEPSYDYKDKYDTYSTTEVNHYVATSELIWKERILELEQKKEKYVAFVVDKVVNVKLNVSVDLDVE